MLIELHRKKETQYATLGDFYINGQFLCHVLEDVVRDLGPNGEGKVMGATAIPAGTYKVDITFSQRFQRELPILLDVPFFTGIRIHKGNTSENTHGCLLVGMDIGGEDLITHSTEAWNLVWPKLQAAKAAGDEMQIVITDDFKGEG